MKKVLLVIVISMTAFSCGSDSNKNTVDEVIASQNLEAIQQRRTEVKSDESEIQDKLKKLDLAIKKLDKTDNSALVTTQLIKDTLFQHFIEILGNVETKQNVIIYPEYQGTLSKVFVKEGDRVNKGQILARIDDGGLSSQLSQLESQEALAKTTYERQKRLWDQQIGSEIQYLQAKTSYESASNTVEQVRSQLAKTNIRAPFSGVIDDVITEQGTVVSPGQQLFRIVNLNNMYIKADVPERYIKSVTVGKDVEVYFPVLNENYSTTVRQTGSYLKPGNRSFSIEVDVPNENGLIKPNLSAKVKINDYTNDKAVLIPQNIISENANGDKYVYIANIDPESEKSKATAQREVITTGKTQGDYIEVLSGLSPGDIIIVEGARSIKDGQEVKY
jgi:membrane fusion protein (multidrug efflux system)